MRISNFCFEFFNQKIIIRRGKYNAYKIKRKRVKEITNKQKKGKYIYS